MASIKFWLLLEASSAVFVWQDMSDPKSLTIHGDDSVVSRNLTQSFQMGPEGLVPQHEFRQSGLPIRNFPYKGSSFAPCADAEATAGMVAEAARREKFDLGPIPMARITLTE